MKKVLWFIWDFKVAGGGERFVIEGVKSLIKLGIRCKIVVVDLQRFEYFDESLDLQQIKIPTYLRKKPFAFLFTLISLKQIIKDFAPSMILTQDIRGYVLIFLSTIFSKVKGSIIDFGQMYQFDNQVIHSSAYKKKTEIIKKTVEDLGEKISENKRKNLLKFVVNELKGLLLYLSFKNSENIFTLSEKVQKEDIILYNKKSIVLKGAYDDSIFELKDNGKLKSKLKLDSKIIILSIGRLIKNKRVDLLIEAMKFIKVDNVVLMIGGKGAEFENLNKLVKEKKLEEKVKFLGFIPEEELLNYYLSCDVFTTMDHADFDITTYLALGLGKKVVWPKVMEIDDNLKQLDYIFPTLPEPEQIAKAFTLALSKEKNEMSDEERKTLEKYTWDNCFYNIYKVIK